MSDGLSQARPRSKDLHSLDCDERAGHPEARLTLVGEDHGRLDFSSSHGSLLLEAAIQDAPFLADE
jgi:hypothetical protein